MNQFDLLEKLAQQLIEGTFHRLFRTRLHPADLTEHLLAAVENGRQNGNGANLLPNHYQITVNPVDYAVLVEESSGDMLAAELHHFLIGLAAAANYQFGGPLRVALAENKGVEPGQVDITTEYNPGLG